jgi:methyl-accepting chemotaxis protein
MENLLPIFVALTGAAVLLQAGLLAAMYLAMRKTSAKMEALADEVKTKALPAIDSAQALLTEMRPKVEAIAEQVKTISENVADTTATVRSQIHRVDATVNEVVDRARLQVIRADDMLTRTFDRVESASEAVHKTVVSPVRQVSGIFQGLTTGLEFLFAGRGRKNGNSSRDARRPVPQDEMFI